jgi:hypothetical protein
MKSYLCACFVSLCAVVIVAVLSFVLYYNEGPYDFR